MKFELLINIEIAKFNGLSGLNHPGKSFIMLIKVKKPKNVGIFTFEPRREINGFLHMRKQRRRSASR